jgi:hypothetical protein
MLENVQGNLEQRLGRLERRMDEMSRDLEVLSNWHKFELRERSGGPEAHDGKRVIGRIPIWGSGRYILVLKTPKDKFELDII